MNAYFWRHPGLPRRYNLGYYSDYFLFFYNLLVFVLIPAFTLLKACQGQNECYFTQNVVYI